MRKRLLLFILIVAGLVALTYANRDWVKRRLSHNLIALLQEKSDITLVIGEYSVSLFPQELHIHDLKIKREGFTLRLPYIGIKFSLFDLFSPTIEIDDIHLDEPTITIILDKIGTSTNLTKKEDTVSLSFDRFLTFARPAFGNILIRKLVIEVKSTDRVYRTIIPEISLSSKKNRRDDFSYPLHTIRIADGEFIVSENGHSLRFKKLKAKMTFDEVVLKLDEFRMKSHDGTLSGGGNLKLGDDYAYSLDLTGTASLPGFKPLLTLDTVQSHFSFVSSMSGKGLLRPDHVSMKITVEDIAYDIFRYHDCIIEAVLDKDQARINVFSFKDNANDLQAKGSIGLEQPYPFEGTVNFADYSLKKILSVFSLKQEVIDLVVNGEGQFDGTAYPFILHGSPKLKITELKLKAGSTDILSLDKASIDGQMTVRTDGITVSLAKYSVGQNNATIRANFSFDDEMNLSFNSDNFCIEDHSPLLGIELGGCAKIDASISGPYNHLKIEPRFSFDQALLKGVSLDHLSGSFVYENEKFLSDSIFVELGGGHAQIKGSVDLAGAVPTIGVNALFKDIDPGIGLQLPSIPLKGMFHGDIDLAGTFESPTVRLKAHGVHVRIDKEMLDTVDADISFAENELLSATLSASIEKGTIRISGDGGLHTPLNYTFKADNIDLGTVENVDGFAQEIEGNLDISGTIVGSREDPIVKGKIVCREIYYAGKEVGTAIVSANIENGIIYGQGKIDRLASFTGMYNYLSKDFRLDSQFDELHPLSYLSRKDFPELKQFKDTLSGRVEVSGRIGMSETIVGRLQLKDFSLSQNDMELTSGNTLVLDIADNLIILTQAKLSLLGEEIKLNGSLTFDGNLDIAVASEFNLANLAKFTGNENISFKGQAVLDARISGSVADPIALGSLFLSDGGLHHHPAKLSLDAVETRIRFSQNIISIDELRGIFSGGSFSGSGAITLSDFRIIDVAIDGSIHDIVYRYNGFESKVEAALNLSGNPDQLILKGDILCKKLSYKEKINWKRELLAIGKTLEQQSPPQTKTPPWLYYDVGIVAPSGIIVKNNLADLEMRANLHLGGDVDSPQITGSINAVRGLLFFRENEFEIKRGIVSFKEGPTINPTFNLSAQTVIKDYQLTIAAEGDSQNQKISYTAIPYLDEPDIISLLEFGVVSKDIEDIRLSVLQEAADLLIVSQIQDPVESKIRQYIPIIKSIEIVPSFSDLNKSIEPLLIVSSELSPTVGLIYKTGLINANQHALLDYRVNRNFSVLANWKDLRERNENVLLQRSELGLDFRFRFEFK